MMSNVISTEHHIWTWSNCTQIVIKELTPVNQEVQFFYYKNGIRNPKKYCPQGPPRMTLFCVTLRLSNKSNMQRKQNMQITFFLGFNEKKLNLVEKWCIMDEIPRLISYKKQHAKFTSALSYLRKQYTSASMLYLLPN